MVSLQNSHYPIRGFGVTAPKPLLRVSLFY